MKNELKIGVYRHHKGNTYKVIEVAKDSETLVDMVVYKELYGEGNLWVRPLSMFIGTFEKDGKKIQRFEYIGE